MPPDELHWEAVRVENQRAWDARVRKKLIHTRWATDEDLKDPLRRIDPEGWIGSLRGRRVLCLASGGGLQSALCAAAGGRVTVLDLSAEMLAQDTKIADKYGFKISVVEGSMEDLSMLPQAGFDVVLQPVSTCYVPDIKKVYGQVARVTAPDGIYVSQHKQPSSLQASALPSPVHYVLTEPYHRSGPLPPIIDGYLHREGGTHEFLHRWEDLIGGLCRSGFVIEDMDEPRHADINAPPGSFGHRSLYLPPYVRIKARRTAVPSSSFLITP